MSQMAAMRTDGMRSIDSMSTRPWAPQPMTATRSSSALFEAAGAGTGAACGGSCAKADPASAAPSPAVAEDLRKSRRLIRRAAGVLTALPMVSLLPRLRPAHHTIRAALNEGAGGALLSPIRRGGPSPF